MERHLHQKGLLGGGREGGGDVGKGRCWERVRHCWKEGGQLRRGECGIEEGGACGSKKRELITYSGCGGKIEASKGEAKI
jgi:hypothetical protein